MKKVCPKCETFFARFKCNAPDECDCPQCQGLCSCGVSATRKAYQARNKTKVRTPISDAAAENFASQGDYDAGMSERMMVPLGVAQELEERLTERIESEKIAMSKPIRFPDSVGFWWMNDTHGIGWEVVRVSRLPLTGELIIYRAGYHNAEEIQTHCVEWVKIEKPS